MDRLKFEIVPSVGVGPIHLNASRDYVLKSLSAVGIELESSRGGMDYFCDSSIQIEYSEDKTVDFIGTAYHDSIQVFYEGVDVFDVVAKDLFELISKHEDVACEYHDYEYVFPKQIVTLWDAQEQYDKYQDESRIVWAQVGLGNLAYKKDIEEINQSRS